VLSDELDGLVSEFLRTLKGYQDRQRRIDPM